jgi:hypothetical protein
MWLSDRSVSKDIQTFGLGENECAWTHRVNYFGSGQESRHGLVLRENTFTLVWDVGVLYTFLLDRSDRGCGQEHVWDFITNDR